MEELFGGVGGGGGGADLTIGGNSTSAGAGYALISTGTALFAGGSNITLSQNGNSITILGETNSGATTFLGGAGSLGNTLGTTGLVNNQLYLVGGTNITLSQSTNAQSATLTISADNPFKAGVSTGGNTAGTTGTVSNQVLFVGGSNVTLSQSSAAGGATVTVNAQQATGFVNSISVVGNTAGDITAGTGRLILGGGNNVTLSGATAAGAMTLTISAGAGGGGIAASLSGNSTSAGAGYSNVTSGTLILAGGNNITLSQDGASVTISGANAGGAQTGISGISASDTVYSSGTVKFTGSGIVTVKSGTGQAVVIDAAAGLVSIADSAVSGSGPVVQFLNSNNITFGLVGNTMTASVAPGGINASVSGGNTAGVLALISSGTMGIAGGNEITVSQQGGNAITISGPVPREAVTIAGNVTSGGAGYGLISTGTLVLAGGNNITLSQDGHSVTISAPSGGGAGVSSGGNTLGTTGTVDYQLVFAGGSNITLSQSVNGSSGTITIVGGGGAANVISASGNTDGTLSTQSTGTIVLAGGSNITLSQSSNTISIIGASGGGGGGTLSQWMPPGPGYSSFTPQGQSTLVVFPAPLQADLSVSRADLWGSVSVNTSTGSTYQGGVSMYLGIYTRNTSTLSLASSGSVTYSWFVSGTTSSGSYVGLRQFSLPINAVMTPGDYWMGLLSVTSSSNKDWITISNLQLAGFATAYSGPFGGATNASNQFLPGLGVFSAQTAALPASVAFGGLLATSASTARPVVNLLNFTA